MLTELTTHRLCMIDQGVRELSGLGRDITWIVVDPLLWIKARELSTSNGCIDDHGAQLSGPCIPPSAVRPAGPPPTITRSYNIE